MNIGELYAVYQKSKGVMFDSRILKKGQLFFALVTDKNDGHAYVDIAFQKGACAAVVSSLEKVPVQYHSKVFLVSDTKQALHELARYHRMQLAIPIIGIAGSNGKTTTKELLVGVLSKKYRVCATKANENNDIGVSVTLLSVNPRKYDMAIIELGTNHSGELKLLCDIARPTHGILTSFGKEHLEGFRNMKGVVTEEIELVSSLDQDGGTLFWNRDIKEVSENKISSYKNLSPVFFGGKKKDSIVRMSSVMKVFPTLSFEVVLGDTKFIINTKLAGTWNTGNILAAVAIGEYFDVSRKDMQSAIVSYQPTSMRSESFMWKGRKIFLDAYNANPTSMELVWKDVSRIPGNKLCIIGGMKEMGKEEKKEHGALVDLITTLKLKECFFVGLEWKPFVKKIEQNKHHYFETAMLCKKYLMEHLPPKDTFIVLKASKGIHLWEIVDKKFS